VELLGDHALARVSPKPWGRQVEDRWVVRRHGARHHRVTEAHVDLRRNPSRAEASLESDAHPLVLGFLGDALPDDARRIEDQPVGLDLVPAHLLDDGHDVLDVVRHLAQKMSLVGRVSETFHVASMSAPFKTKRSACGDRDSRKRKRSMAKYWSNSSNGRPSARASLRRRGRTEATTFVKDWLPETYADQNTPGLDDVCPFGLRSTRHGQKTLLRQEDAAAFDAERTRPVRPPAIQGLLHKARELRCELDGDPDLTQAALAARMGVSRPRVTQLLHLLKLPDEAQEIILGLPPTANGCPITERALRPLLALDDPEAQLEGIRELLGNFVPAGA